MSDKQKLIIIKIFHTLIWLFFNAVIFYLLIAVILNKIDTLVWICIALLVLEGLVLVAFKSICPVTLAARKYSNSKKSNFDIYLPEWLATYNKIIYTTIVIIALIILACRLLLK